MGSGHEFRNEDKFQRLGYRDWIREHMPSASAGYVVEDLDLVLRVYGPSYQTDDTGKFRLVELKYGTCNIGRAQEMTFGLLDGVLRDGDPKRQRYDGYYLVNYDDEDWEKANFMVNGQGLTTGEFVEWMEWKIDIDPLWRT